MLNFSKPLCAVLAQLSLISPAIASEQSQSNGFIDDASASLLLRNGFFHNEKIDYTDHKRSTTWGQSAMLNAQSGFTQGTVGFAVGVLGDYNVRLASNSSPSKSTLPFDDNNEPYRQWARGGAFVKVRVSDTTLTYGTQILDIPILSSNAGRLGSEFFTGTLIRSNEIKNLELVAGKFTKNQMATQISTDKDILGHPLERAYLWGGKYQFNDNLKAAYYGVDSKNKLKRHYGDINYTLPLADKQALTFDLTGYHTQWEKDAITSSSRPGVDPADRSNSIWAFSTTYSKGAQSIGVAYQQNTGNTGFAYGENADGYNTIAVPISYLSDFIGRGEKSAQIQYNLNFADYGLPGLSWTTAYAYGWNIGTTTSSNAKEREFFNQVKYTVQSGFAKGVIFRARNSIYRADDAYANDYIPSMNEWRVYLDIPIKLF